MLGMEGIAVPLGFILTFASAILCIGFGIKNWNKGFAPESENSSTEARNEKDRKAEGSL